MKKLISLFVITLMMFGFSVQPKPIEVGATPTAFTWTSQNLYSTNYQLESGEIFFYTNKVIEITFPSSMYHRFYLSSIGNAQVRFMDFAGNFTDYVFFEDLRSDYIGDTYILDLNLLGIDSSAVKLDIRIPQAYSSTPANYVTYMNNGSTYDLNPPGVLTARFWGRDDVFVDEWVLDWEFKFFDIPYNPMVITGPALTDYAFIGWYLDGNKYNFNFGLTSSYTGYVNFYAEYRPWIEIVFMDGLSVYDDADFVYFDEPAYYPVAPTPAPTRSGYTFIGWKSRTGEFYSFNRLPNLEEFNPYDDTQFTLYASYQINSPSGTTYPPNTPTAITAVATLLNNYGMYNFPSLMFIYFVTMLVLNGLLGYYLKPSSLVHFIISIAVTILFAFMNLIPLYALIPIGLILVVGLIASINGNTLGGANE